MPPSLNRQTINPGMYATNGRYSVKPHRCFGNKPRRKQYWL